MPITFRMGDVAPAEPDAMHAVVPHAEGFEVVVYDNRMIDPPEMMSYSEWQQRQLQQRLDDLRHKARVSSALMAMRLIQSGVRCAGCGHGYLDYMDWQARHVLYAGVREGVPVVVDEKCVEQYNLIREDHQ